MEYNFITSNINVVAVPVEQSAPTVGYFQSGKPNQADIPQSKAGMEPPALLLAPSTSVVHRKEQSSSVDGNYVVKHNWC